MNRPISVATTPLRAFLWLWGFLSAIGFIGNTPVVDAGEPLAKGVQFYVGHTPGRPPTGRVDIQKILTVPSKRGFLSISALPVLVAQEVHFHCPSISSPGALAVALREIPQNLRAMARTEAIELRQFRILTGTPPSSALSAEEVLFDSPEAWTLRNARVPGRLDAKSAKLYLGQPPHCGLQLGEHWIPLELSELQQPSRARGSQNPPSDPSDPSATPIGPRNSESK